MIPTDLVDDVGQFDFSGQQLFDLQCKQCGGAFEGRAGRQFCCQSCANRYKISKRTRAELKASKDAANLMHRYGLTPEQLSDMDAAQLNRCEICGNEMGEGRRRHIDHNHKTGKVRALLCAGCNTALGRIEMVGVEKFAAYLKTHESEEKE